MTYLLIFLFLLFPFFAWGQEKLPVPAEPPNEILVCGWSSGQTICAGPGNPILTSTRATVQQCPDSTTLRTANYTQVAINTACITVGAGILVEGQRYNYLGNAKLDGSLIPISGNTPSLAISEYTYWDRGAVPDLDICKMSGAGTVVINGVTITGGSLFDGGTCYGVGTSPATGTRITITVDTAVLGFYIRTPPTYWQLENGTFISTPVENVGALGTSTYRAADIVQFPAASIVNPNNYGGVIEVLTEWDAALISLNTVFYSSTTSGSFSDIVSNGGWGYAQYNHGATQIYGSSSPTAYVPGELRTLNWWVLAGRGHARHSVCADGANSDKSVSTFPFLPATVTLGSQNGSQYWAFAWIKSLKICAGACREQLREWGNP